MLSKLKNRKEKGFTIIEVLIVLAIAGLILLVVFLAVPALQRNARNTSRNNDVAGLLGGMSEYVNNNNGTLPAAQGVGAAGTTYTIGDASATNEVEVSLGYYGGDSVSIALASSGVTNDTTENTVKIVLRAKCGTGGNATTSGASSRGYVALFTLEKGSKQCKES